MKLANANIKESIAGVVILYNPDNTISANIHSYLNQIDFLYIIDNSEEQLQLILDLVECNKNRIEYIFNNKNIGVAAALNFAARCAQVKGYQFLLTMDQDSTAPPDMINNLMEAADLYENIGIISPSHKSALSSSEPSNNKFSFPQTVMTSGNLLNLSAFKIVGDFNEDLFIDYVDTEYCLRLLLKKFIIVQNNTIILNHREANPLKKKVLFRTVYLYNHSPVRFYYKSRNRFYLRRKYKKTFPDLFKTESKLFWRTLFKVLFFEQKKILKFKMVFWGFADFMRQRMGHFQK